MKKMLSMMLLMLSAVLLVACGSGKNINGSYKNYYQVEGYSVQLSSVDYLEIGDATIETWDGEYEIDKQKQTVSYKDGQVKAYTVDSKTGVITFDDKTYVKVGSKYYQQLLDEGAIED